jgi:hypothetical protein
MNSIGTVSGGRGGRFGVSDGGDGYAIPIDHALAIAHEIVAGQSSSTVHIGDRAILAGGSKCCFAGWCPATESGLLPNGVYWVHPSDGRLYVYDVGANTEEVCELGDGAGELSRLPFWIVPRI